MTAAELRALTVKVPANGQVVFIVNGKRVLYDWYQTDTKTGELTISLTPRMGEKAAASA